MSRLISTLVLAGLVAGTPARAADDERALKFVKDADGTVTRDESRPGKPVVAVKLKGLKGDPSPGGKPAGLAALTGLPLLNTLDLSGCEVYDRNLEELAALPALRSLTLARCEFLRDAGLRHIARLDKLTALDLSEVTLSDVGVKELAALKGLTALNLSGNSFVKLDGVRLAALTELVELNLSGTGVRDAGLKQVAELGKLTTLDLGGTLVTEKGLKELAALPKLESVRLAGCRAVRDPAAEQLAALKGLRVLDLSETPVTDKGLKHLAGVKGLARLRLDGCKWVTGAGLKEFAGSDLLSLSLRETRLQPRDVDHLAELKRLGTLDLRDAGGLRKEDFDRLQKLLPDCKIVR